MKSFLWQSHTPTHSLSLSVSVSLDNFRLRNTGKLELNLKVNFLDKAPFAQEASKNAVLRVKDGQVLMSNDLMRLETDTRNLECSLLEVSTSNS